MPCKFLPGRDVGTGDVGNFEWLSPQDASGYYKKKDLITYIPEPATLLFLGTGMAGLAAFRKRSKKA